MHWVVLDGFREQVSSTGERALLGAWVEDPWFGRPADKYLTMTDAKKVWMPDTFFRNEKEGRFHNILVPNVYIRIFPNGDVLYSIR